MLKYQTVLQCPGIQQLEDFLEGEPIGKLFPTYQPGYHLEGVGKAGFNLGNREQRLIQVMATHLSFHNFTNIQDGSTVISRMTSPDGSFTLDY